MDFLSLKGFLFLQLFLLFFVFFRIHRRIWSDVGKKEGPCVLGEDTERERGSTHQEASYLCVGADADERRSTTPS